MNRDQALNIIAGIILACKDFDTTKKAELLKWLRHVEELAAEFDE